METYKESQIMSGGAHFQEDYYRNTGETWCGSIRQRINVLLNHGCLYMFIYRMWQKNSKNFFWRTARWKVMRKYGLEIDSKNIGRGFRLVHPYNITISPLARLGDNCTIHKGATIGRESRGVRQGAPAIGDRVWIGINATVVGHIYIGNNVLIAPNAYVNCNVPDNSIVIGCPCKVLNNRLNAVDGYL